MGLLLLGPAIDCSPVTSFRALVLLIHGLNVFSGQGVSRTVSSLILIVSL